MIRNLKYIWILIVIKSTLLFATSTQISDSISIYNNLSQYNYQIHNYEKAVFYANKSLKYSQSKNNIQAQAQSNFVLGTIHYNLKNYNEAQVFFEQSSLLNTKTPSDLDKFKALYFAGFCSIEKKEWQKANQFFNKADKLYQIASLKTEINLLLLTKAKLYFKNNNNHISSINLKRVITNAETIKNYHHLEEAYLYSGIISLKQKKKSIALEFFNKAFALNKQTKNLKNKVVILYNLSKCYKEMQVYEQAYFYLEEYYVLKIHLDKISNLKQNQENLVTFKQDEAFKSNLKKTKEEYQKTTTYRYSKLINVLALALILILSLLSLVLYKNNIIRNESNKLLTETNQELVIAKNNAEKASKARSEFLSTVSHELRTPLNAINGITHLLIEENPKKSQLNYLVSLQFSGNLLTTLVNEILEFNKIESKKVELESISFNIKELLHNIQTSLNKFAQTNNNEFNLIIDEEIPTNLIGDPTRVSQVLLNLINNALKFTHNGTVSIVVNLVKRNVDNVKINFQITDTGIGIPEEKHELVFENFSQGSVEINRKYGGTGLGLTIVKKLVKLLGGKIKLNSEVGKGSTFYFNLPFKIAENAIDTTPKVISYNDGIFKSKKVLLVEDNKINQMITQKMLENKNIVCVIIDNGESAVKLMGNHDYDLVLMDVHLPGINGTEATKQIRVFDTATPIIALTAISLDENREMLLSYGMNEVITKPFNPEEFYTIISKYLEINTIQ